MDEKMWGIIVIKYGSHIFRIDYGGAFDFRLFSSDNPATLTERLLKTKDANAIKTTLE